MSRRRLMGLVSDGYNPNAYIEFADATLGSILATKYGDGVGLTYAQAAAVTRFPDWGIGINDRTDITSFNEINYFTGLQYIGHICFRNTPNMIIDDLRLPSLTSVGGHVFMNSGVKKVSDLGKLSLHKSWDFSYMFSNCTKLETAVCPEAMTMIFSRMMNECPILKHAEFQNVATIQKDMFFYKCTVLETLILRSTSLPTGPLPYCFMTYVPTTCKIYVADGLVDTFKATAPWSTRASQIYPLSEYVPS